jgi:hypothetical protein
MAIIISSTGVVTEVAPDPQIGYFTMKTIYNFLKALVEPVFIGTKWMFHCKTGLSLGYQINKQASEIAGFLVYGDVLIADDFELSPTFFIPEDLKKEIKEEIVKFYKNFEKSYQNELSQNIKQKRSKRDILSLLKEDGETINEFTQSLNRKETITEKIMSSLYKYLFGSKKSFKQLMKNFILKIDNTEFAIEDSLEYRKKIFNTLLQFYINKEDYEKCEKIKKYIENLNKYYEVKNEKN